MLYPVYKFNFLEELSLFIPNPKEVKAIYEKLVIENEHTLFPFWAKVWPASIALTQFLKNHPQWIANKNILEIGAGIALPSFAIAKLAKNLIISDYAPEAVALIEKNISLQKLTNTKALVLDWNHFPNDVFADTILLSDINYAPDQFEALLNLIQGWLIKETVIIIATPQRIMANSFVTRIWPFVKHTEIQTVKEGEVDVDISILVLMN
jgi:predicted nicotinamide N-methyase